MNALSKIVAGICIFSTLFMGCYSSSMIDFAGGEKEKIYSNDITSVLTKDGKKYEFETPPVVSNDTIVGVAKVSGYTQVKKDETSIPQSDVAYVGISNSGSIAFVVTKAGAKYTYEEPPTVVEAKFVGKAKFTGVTPMRAEQVSIPLSDVEEISVSELNSGGTAVAILLGVVIVAGIIAVFTVGTGPVLTSNY